MVDSRLVAPRRRWSVDHETGAASHHRFAGPDLRAGSRRPARPG